MDSLDPISLATAATTALGEHLRWLTTGSVDGTGEAASNRVVRAVSDRLQASRSGREVLLRLQERPDDPACRDAASAFLVDEIKTDAAFGRNLVRALKVKAGNPRAASRPFIEWQPRSRRASRGDGPRRSTFGSGKRAGVVAGLAAVAVVLIVVIVIANSGPAYPELEGGWSGGISGAELAMHVTDEQFTFEIEGGMGHLICSGTISDEDDQHYVFATEHGVCGHIEVTLNADGDAMDFNFKTFGEHELKRD